MREVIGHLANGEVSPLKIRAVDQPGPGGANHLYVVSGANLVHNSSLDEITWLLEEDENLILFQKGPLTENPHNGLSIEVLLAICKDRLESFQAGPFPCAENQAALESIKEALNSLHSRTANRIARQVEGTNKQ